MRTQDGRIVEPRKSETPLMKASMDMTDAILKKLQNEKFFPRRFRWLIAGKIADLANDYMTAIIEANDPKVQTQGLRDRRFELQQIALGKLSALDVKLAQAVRVMELNPNELEYIAGLVNRCRELMQAWVNSDKKRYGSPSGLNIQGDG